MLKTIKVSAFIIASLIYSNLGFSCNSKLLDSYADSFNECIWSKHPITIDRIQDDLNFLDSEKDQFYVDKYAGQNIFSQNEQYIDDLKNEQMKVFFYNCRDIYDANEEIDPLTQTSIQMMFERVFHKYNQHSKLLASVNPLLPNRLTENSQLIDKFSFTTKTEAVSESLYNDFPLEYQKKVFVIINNIAIKFFPEVRQGKLSLEQLSLKCGTPLKELETNYSNYLQSN